MPQFIFNVMVRANVWAGRYYDYSTAAVKVVANDEQEAIGKALSLLDIDVPLSNRSVSYNVMDIVLKDEYV